MIRLSAVIITLNEEKNLERCLASLQNVADEIIIVDSLSTDNTLSIAKQFNAKIILQPFLGYVAQKQLADDNATYDWVLSIDADEVLTPELEQSILTIKNNPQLPAYTLKRLTNYCGKWIKHCGWYPDRKLRLYDRTKGSWQGEQVHEYWQPHDKTIKPGKLEGDLLHYSFSTISDHIRQIEKFTEIAAHAAAAKGKRYSLLKTVIAPRWEFVRMYILQLGFLDGYYGYLVCLYSSYASSIKYTKTRQYARKQQQAHK